jgi:chaperonin cofactor prefoldin
MTDEGYLDKILKKSSPEIPDNIKTEIKEKHEILEETQTISPEQPVEKKQSVIAVEESMDDLLEEIAPPNVEYAEEPPSVEPVEIIQPEEKPKTSFIETYIETLSKDIDTPTFFIEASALHILSALFSRFIVVPQHKMCRPNLYFLIGSVPGRTRRSTLAKYDKRIFSEIYGLYVNKIKQTSTLEIPVEAYCIFEQGSIEGLIDDIEQYRKTFTELPLMNDKYKEHNKLYHIDFQSTEFGDTLSAMSGDNSYLKGMARLLSKLYYGEGGKISLSHRGGKKSRYLRDNTYGTMFVLMQKVGLYLDKYLIDQGFLRRCILINKKADKHLPPLKEFDPGYEDRIIKSLMDNLQRKMENVLAWLEKSHEKFDKPIMARISTDVEQEINKISAERDADVDANEEDNVALFRQSESEILVKLSVIYAIDNESVIDPESPFLFVRMDHYRKAKKFYDEATAEADDIIRNIGVEKGKPKTDVALYNNVLSNIKSTGDDGIGWSDLLVKKLRVTGRNYTDAAQVVRGLLDVGVLEEFEGESIGGRPPTLLRIKKQT